MFTSRSLAGHQSSAAVLGFVEAQPGCDVIHWYRPWGVACPDAVDARKTQWGDLTRLLPYLVHNREETKLVDEVAGSKVTIISVGWCPPHMY